MSRRVLTSIAVLWALFASGQPSRADDNTPVIRRLEAVAQQGQLRIEGRNFGNGPRVWLNGSLLPLSTASDQLIVAALPAGLTPASYKVIVHRPDAGLLGRTDEAEVTISAPLLKRYQDTLAAFRGALNSFCTKRGMSYLFTSNQVPFEKLVLGYLRSRGLLR